MQSSGSCMSVYDEFVVLGPWKLRGLCFYCQSLGFSSGDVLPKVLGLSSTFAHGSRVWVGVLVLIGFQRNQGGGM